MQWEKSERAFSVLMAGFAVAIVLTNIIGVKLFLAFPEAMPHGLFGEAITLTTGLLTYPVTFLLTDIVCEVWGRRRANLMVVTGFVMSLLSLVLIQVTLALPGSPAWAAGNPNYDTVTEMQRAFESVFTLPGVLILGSMTAYLIAQLMDVSLFHFWKRVTRGRHLWLPWDLIGRIIVAAYLFKVLIALLDTPFVYLGVALVRRLAAPGQAAA
jgi:uncharacterized integral membrane protein (TIGR00697 family)